jgi:hypothetical protein
MFPSEIENRYTNHRHLEGGVAPSRYALARHTYLERKKRAIQKPIVSTTETRESMLTNAVTLVKFWFFRIEAYWSAEQRTPQ